MSNKEAAIEAVSKLISGRRSVRAFLSTPVEKDVIEKILDLAKYAPSGSNTQPWKVYVVTGAKQREVIGKLTEAFNATDAATRYLEEYAYYPREWKAPYIDRRRKLGWDLYSLLGIEKGAKDKMHAQHRRNVEFFGAPVSLFFTIDRIMEQGSWLDYGMFLQNVMLAARGYGLATCPQAAINPFHSVLREALGWTEEEMLVCSMSLGYEDPDAIANQLEVEREQAKNFSKFFE